MRTASRNFPACHVFLRSGFTVVHGLLSILGVKTTLIRACVTALLLCVAATGHAQGNTELELNALKERAAARQASIEAQLASTTDSAERARLEDLSARNNRVLAAYDARLSGSGSPAAPSNSAAAPSNSPAAPESSGGMFSGLTSKLSGLMGGGSSSNPNGPESMSFGGADGQSFDIKSYLKQNWPNLVGGMVGSIAGGMIASRLMGGNKLAGIAGSIAGGWIGGKIADFIATKVRGNSGSSSPQAQAPAPAQQSGPATYTTNASGQPVYNNGGVQITYPQGYTAGAPAAPVRNLTEARELMTGRYQAFLAAGSNPTLQATAYQNYMQSKQQYETLAAQARAAAQ